MDAQVEPQTLALGERGPAFHNLPGVDGKRYGFPTFSDARILVLIFSSNRCPTVKAYEDRLIALQKGYGPRGVRLVAINSNNPYLYPEESFEEMIRRATDRGFTFPYLQDLDQSAARSYGAVCTFHLFVLDKGRRLRYRGRFDDSRNPDKVTSHDLKNALDDLLGGREVRVPDTVPFGCSLDYL